MANNQMLIDAAHPEETRVVVLRGSKVEEFDFESATRRQLRGNIYLAKVTRVEPSLQAAFVDYGGNRHGFLAFSEIHPDYYQIPVADREKLIAEEEEEETRERHAEEKKAEEADTVEDADEDSEAGDDAEAGAIEEVVGEGDNSVESVGNEDALEEVPQRRNRQRRHYKIQEVIKRRQILLVQVVKEERGNKGAALTTYLSLAGRYCVLMPNTARGGGISRKITNSADRKRLKEVAGDLEIGEGMGVILRTAGASRTKTEIKRDFEYLLRLWENVRELTLKSVAPALVYEEGSLVKRAIRDLYSKEIDEILVAGDGGYKDAKDFMRMLMPSHARHVKAYKDPMPLFARDGVEAQLDAMFNPQVTLKSGGYLVINQTEALVSIDVNSGRSTREHNIEDTALRTNLEAADEVARQLRLRDLAGLIVIDFIDMEEKRNNRSVERRLKDALKNDRARIQVGRISPFGLLEMSRQRIRSGLLEGSLKPCPHCHGTGSIRSTESTALHILRSIEAELIRKATDLTVQTATAAALYILNQKRQSLQDLEARFGATILIEANDDLGVQIYRSERGEPARGPQVQPPVTVDDADPDEDLVDEAFDEEIEEEAAERGRDDDREDRDDRHDERGEGGGRRRRRRRRRGGGERRDEEQRADSDAGDGEEADSAEHDSAERDSGDEDGDQPKRSRRRGRRGGRRRRERREMMEAQGGDEAAETPADEGDEGDSEPSAETVAEAAENVAEAAPEPIEAEAEVEAAPEPEAKPKRRSRAKKKDAEAETAEAAGDADAAEPKEKAKPARKPRSRSKKAEAAKADDANGADTEPVQEAVVEEAVVEEAAVEEPAAAEEPAEQPQAAREAVDDTPPSPPRRGWWQRRAT
ncbi:MAG: ribonuclease E/G [Flavobacteriaceae bacterium]